LLHQIMNEFYNGVPSAATFRSLRLGCFDAGSY
jgi:hypothetical protein